MRPSTPEFSYTVTGWTRDATDVKFYAARGDVISVDATGNVVVKNEAGAELLNVPISVTRGRHLLGRGAGYGMLSTTGSFTLSGGGGTGDQMPA